MLMKKLLLFAAVVLMVSTASAQSTSAASHSRFAAMKERMSKPVRHSNAPRRADISQISTMQEMQVRDTDAKLPNVAKSPVRAGVPEPRYHRPAGMFSATFVAYDDFWSYHDYCFLIAKPYAEYRWTGTATGAGSSTSYAWDFWMNNNEKHYLDGKTELVFSTAMEWDTVPVFHAVSGGYVHPNADWYDYQLKSYIWDMAHDSIKYTEPACIISANDNEEVNLQMYGEEDESPIHLYSSKTMTCTEKTKYILTYYYGATPWGVNDYGWWFGKNGSHVDGIGQAFEKPQHPYTLTDVYLLTYNLNVTSSVTLTCKVYRLDKIPAYRDDQSVVLPEVPGELIAKGRAVVTPGTVNETDGLITFSLYGEEDGLEYDWHPTIDYPILVCIEGYNDPSMDGLVDFTAFISTDYETDEGFGELAYLKWGQTDDEGNFTGGYQWKGLDHAFSNGMTMKTGLSIFIGIENQFVKFADWRKEDGEHLFPDAGGVLMKTYCNGDTVFYGQGIEFYSSVPSEDEGWFLTCNGRDDLPDWLSIDLTDRYVNGKFSGYVVASVVADPLPAGVDYREATVRFEIPGDYIDYKFMQGVQPVGLRGDVNTDGQVSISDVTCLIDLLLNGTPGGPTADVNADNNVTISDVTRLIDILLNGEEPAQIINGNRIFTVNGVMFKMVAVEGGTFAMGATRDQGTGTGSNEKPIHQVTLSDYYIGQTEVTQALWLAVMGSNPSHFTGDLNRPVEYVSWNECRTFITRLNQLTGMQFRLPTEAEWEFAARGGNRARGNMYAGGNSVDDVAWYNSNAGGTTHCVGGKAPNELGLFDMSGNVYEYCQDRYTGQQYDGLPEVNPTGPTTGENFVIRGGSIAYGTDYCRVARRWGDAPTSRWNDQGLRLAL